MNVITIDGIEYVKASVIAKQNKYTADYVGQLCRGRKVDAKLIGRTWYVNPLSLDSHKSARYIKNTPAEKTMSSNTETVNSRLDVPSVPRKGTGDAAVAAPTNFLKRVEWQPLKYEVDEYELNPAMSSKHEPVRLNVDLVEAKKLKLKIGQTPVDLIAEALPEVSLTGKLKINSLDVNFDNNPINKASSLEFTVPDTITLEAEHKVIPKTRRTPVKEISESKAVYSVEIHQTDNFSASTFTPSRVAAKLQPADDSTDDSNVMSIVWPWYVVSVIFIIFVVALSTLELTLTAASGDLTWGVGLDFGNSFRLHF